ncbi:MAG: hypothetical protein J2O49_10540, partial [Sciscionella sp.]|nr:hypothetical protein [Sciscionella sp.]
QTRRKRFRHPDVGTITFRVVELAVVAAPELRIMAYTPADDQTWRKLPLTRRRTAGEAAG